MNILKCKICLYFWVTRFGAPKKCPSCQTVKWAVGGRIGLKARGPIQLSINGNSIVRLYDFLDKLRIGENAEDRPVYEGYADESVDRAIRSYGVEKNRKYGIYEKKVWRVS